MDLTLSLTHACNLDCVYCYAGPHDPRAMSWQVAESAIDFAFEQGPIRELTLSFFGGEPLMAWPLLQRATAYAQQQTDARGLRLRLAVTTNGLLLHPERLTWLAAHDFFVTLSIDGNQAMHDATRPYPNGRSSFARCADAVRAALVALPDLDTISVVDPANVRHLAEGVRYLVEEIGVDNLTLNPNFSGSWNESDYDAWRAGYEAVGDFVIERFRAGAPVSVNVLDAKIIGRLKGGFSCGDRCNFGETELAVAPSGRLYPCERLIGDDSDHTMVIGTVEDGFLAKKRRGFLGRRGNVDEACRTCAIRARCMNWCGCVNYATTGAMDRSAAVLCFHEQLTVRVADRVASTLFREGNVGFLVAFYGDSDGVCG